MYIGAYANIVVYPKPILALRVLEYEYTNIFVCYGCLNISMLKYSTLLYQYVRDICIYIHLLSAYANATTCASVRMPTPLQRRIRALKKI